MLKVGVRASCGGGQKQAEHCSQTRAKAKGRPWWRLLMAERNERRRKNGVDGKCVDEENSPLGSVCLFPLIIERRLNYTHSFFAVFRFFRPSSKQEQMVSAGLGYKGTDRGYEPRISSFEACLSRSVTVFLTLGSSIWPSKSRKNK